MKNRRQFIKTGLFASLGAGLLPNVLAHSNLGFGGSGIFKISLAEWSLHNMIEAGELENIDFPAFAKNTFGIEAVEYVNSFFFDKAKDKTYLKELNKRAKNEGVKNVLIMIDNEGQLGDKDVAARTKAVENHYKWVEAAQFLGCHSIRVNAGGQGSREELAKAVRESLDTLCLFAKDYNINVIVENHGGYSSDAKWLTSVIKDVDLPNCGTLPDFGNFTISQETQEKYDKYLGMEELMPFAKAVSAKCYDFDEQGQETSMDFGRIINIVKDGGYKGYIGIEYEGSRLSEVEGVKAAKTLLEEIFKTV
jgi:sugar phosphate isomerase/epimerase